MAKVAALSTLEATSLALLQPVLEGDIQAVVEMQNYAICERPPVLMQANGLVAGLMTTNQPVGLQLYFDGPADTWQTRLVGTCVIPADYTTLRVNGRVSIGGTDTAEVRFNVGASGSATRSYTVLNTGTRQTTTIDTADSGTGVQDWSIEMRRTGASGATAHVISLSIQCEPIDPTNLPDPDNT